MRYTDTFLDLLKYDLRRYENSHDASTIFMQQYPDPERYQREISDSDTYKNYSRSATLLLETSYQYDF
jgi:hypothetical protein